MPSLGSPIDYLQHLVKMLSKMTFFFTISSVLKLNNNSGAVPVDNCDPCGDGTVFGVDLPDWGWVQAVFAEVKAPGDPSAIISNPDMIVWFTSKA